MLKSLVSLTIFFGVVFSITQDHVQFSEFMRKYNKSYKPSEFATRLQNFQNSLKRIEARNNRPGQTAVYAVNQFSDLSVEEFKSTYLMKAFNPDAACIWPYKERFQLSAEKVQAAPTTFDWRPRGAVSAVKNQGQCGSCWTFSTAENIEGQWFLAGHAPVPSLSEQWIVDCSTACLASDSSLCNGGCNGGLPWLAYADIIKHGYLTLEADYSYTAEDGTCQNPPEVGAKIGSWMSVSTDPTQINAVLVEKGPLSITLNADLLMDYSTGVITGDPTDCPNSGSDHAVLLVGYDSTTNPPYWIVKNSWGKSWGEAGYFRIESDNGLCGVNSCVTTSCVATNCTNS